MEPKLCVIEVLAQKMTYAEYSDLIDVHNQDYFGSEIGYLVHFSETYCKWFTESEYNSRFKDNYLDLDDGKFSFTELYYYVYALFGLVLKYANKPAFKSKYESSGNLIENQFIAGIEIRERLVVFHFPLKYYDKFPAQEVPRAPVYTGATNIDYYESMFDDWKLTDEDKARLLSMRPVYYYGQTNIRKE